jgi:ATP-dependent DNA ligase
VPAGRTVLVCPTAIVQAMRLPVMPPVKPMLAKAVPEIPTGEYSYEPKWDGFRSIVFRDGDEVEIGSRNERPMTRYFPEVVEAVKANLPARCVVDGEIVVPSGSGDRLEFETLQQRIHPADSRVRMLAAQTPAHLIAFDLLALGDEALMKAPFAERRERLEGALRSARSPIHVTPATRDHDLAERWFDEFEGAGLDGVVAKPLGIAYEPDKRVMFKIKHVRTADCVVAGYRTHKTDERAIGSLLLGLYKPDGELANVGVVGALPMAQRRTLFEELQPLVTTFDEHPWNWAQEELGTRTPQHSAGSRWSAGKDLTFVPLRPERVVEIRYDHMEGDRLRHTGQLVRWRPDRDPRSCTYEQLEEPVTYDLGEVLALGSSRSRPSKR